MKLSTLCFAALLGFAGTAFGATPAPTAATATGPMHHGVNMCKEHAQECAADAAKFDQWCSANTDRCEALKAWNEKRIEYCSSHTQECEEHREHAMADMKQWCAKNPDKPHCHAITARHQPGDEPDDGSSGEAPPPR